MRSRCLSSEGNSSAHYISFPSGDMYQKGRTLLLCADLAKLVDALVEADVPGACGRGRTPVEMIWTEYVTF